MNSQGFKKIKLPQKPGVYFFYKGKEVIYIGKATSLPDRVKSYFGKDLINTRGPAILDMTVQATSIKYKETDSVLEALILEANLIKKYQPKYNTKEKDNKSFNYVCITKPAHPYDGSGAGGDELPKVLILRGRNLNKEKYQSVYGPFPNGMQLKEAMKIIRPIFPYIDDQSSKRNNKEFYRQLGLVPNFFITPQKQANFERSFLEEERSDGKGKSLQNLREYKNNIKNLILFFEGKKKSVALNLKKEMLALAKNKEFEKANIIKKRIFALNHINDVALIKEDNLASHNFERSFLEEERSDGKGKSLQNYRIEAYDIAHLAGKNMVGVMTVIEGGELAKNEYKKFIIRTQIGSNDTGALEEVLSRRFRHIEWGLPNLIVMDGSTAQVNIAKSVLNRYQFKIPVVSVIKDDKHKAKAIMGDEILIKKYKKQILLLNSESHRFAITFHKQRRNKNFLK
jgi:excinuclease ABC subunit C